MKKDNLYTIIAIVFIIAVGFLLVFSWKSNIKAIQTVNAEGFGAFLPKTLGSTGNGDVEIILIPKKFNSRILEVEINANTHSVELRDFDLYKLITLESNGKKITPTSAPKLNGHHVSGMLIFEAKQMSKDFAITIEGIPLQEKRVFTWS